MLGQQVQDRFWNTRTPPGARPKLRPGAKGYKALELQEMQSKHEKESSWWPHISLDHPGHLDMWARMSKQEKEAEALSGTEPMSVQLEEMGMDLVSLVEQLAEVTGLQVRGRGL
jgi:hypothetical protein